MGDIAEMVLVGFLCIECGGFIDGCETGHPRECEGCIKETEPQDN
jgi:hypothetical protein